MTRVLLLNPSRWGRPITPIWIASHAGALKASGHEVVLFDSTFYTEWSLDETKFNTDNQQYAPSSLDTSSYFKHGLREDLLSCVDSFKPQIIIWSSLSSHIHGEGEYINFVNGYDLVKDLACDALFLAGGIISMALKNDAFQIFSIG